MNTDGIDADVSEGALCVCVCVCAREHLMGGVTFSLYATCNSV